MPGTRKLGKPSDQRRAMLRQQVTDFLDNGRMESTVTRCKEIAPSYEGRNGGYTRITRTGVRRGDAAETAMIELV